MLSTPLFLARGARARAGAALLVLAVAACDSPPPALDPTAASSSLNGVGMVLDLPTAALTLSAASTLHALRPSSHGIDTVAAAWRSSDEHVVSVGPDGRLTPHGSGTATVWARVGRDSASSAVTVTDGPAMQTNTAGFAVKPSVAMMSVGVPQQFSASTQAAVSVAGTAPAVATAPSVTWTSSAPAVATVSSNGTVVPLAPGLAMITATSAGYRATSTVMVTGTRNAASRVDIAVMRFDGGSGPVTVSNGIPFPRGAVTDATLNQLHVFVNGTEQPIFTRALGGRWADGSLRSALVQFTYSIPDARTLAGYMSVGGARTLATPAERPAPATPVAAVLPTAPAYLISTGLVGTVYDPTATRAATTLVAQYEGDFPRLEANDWAQCGANAVWSCGRTAGYDRPFTLYQAWVRTANPTYWQHATALVANYIDGYLVPARGQPAPWWSNSESMALHYWATGDERTRGYVHSMAASLIYQARSEGGYGLGSVPTQLGDDRMRARVLTALIDARMIDAKPTAAGNPFGAEASFYSNYMNSHSLADAVSMVLSTQQASGAFGGTYYVGGQKNYMVGMLLSTLVRYYEEVTPDARIQPAVKRAVDYMFATQWHADVLGFQYCSTDRGIDGDGLWVAPDLDNLIAPAVAWYYNRTGDATYATRVDQMLQGSTVSRSWWQASGKSFDQGFYRIFNIIAWRNR